MAFDAGMMAAVAHEINAFCGELGARVDKVLMPQKDEVVLVLHAGRETKRLLLCVSGNAPRITFTSISKENPASPPMFCMLLRKYLVGAILKSVKQEGFERVARLCFASRDEMGFASDKYLIVEIMGKYSNLMFLDAADKILSVLHPVDFTTSRLRQVLPGMVYELPPPQEKINPLTCTYADFLSVFETENPEKIAEKAITSRFLGTSAQSAREIVFRACKDSSATLAQAGFERLASRMDAWFEDVKVGNFIPTLILSLDSEPLDCAYFPVSYFENAAKTKDKESFGDLFDTFYARRDEKERLRIKSADMQHLLKSEISRLERKCEQQQTELKEAEAGESYRKYGDLVTANLYRLKRGDASFTATDWEDENAPELSVPLDARLSPSANAQRYYKLYNKAKTARRILSEQLQKGRQALAYLSSVAVFLEKAETEEELEGLRAELRKTGYLKSAPQKGKQPQKKQSMPIKTMQTPGGYPLLVGTNNLQNDHITFSVASKDDLWFHVKGMPGAHVILCCNGEEPSAEDYTFAATVAAYYSAAEGKGTAVDYTRVRELKRVPGAGAGFVVYHTNYSAYVDPADFEKYRREQSDG